MFNEESFLSASVETSFDTRRLPIPAGEYTAVIKDIKPRINVQGKKDPSMFYSFLDYELEIQLTPDAQQQMATDQTTIKRSYSVSIEFDDSGTKLASGKGKNVPLGKFREALRQNDSGKPWSPRDPIGKMITAKVTHRLNQEGDPVDQIDAIVAL